MRDTHLTELPARGWVNHHLSLTLNMFAWALLFCLLSPGKTWAQDAKQAKKATSQKASKGTKGQSPTTKPSKPEADKKTPPQKAPKTQKTPKTQKGKELPTSILMVRKGPSPTTKPKVTALKWPLCPHKAGGMICTLWDECWQRKQDSCDELLLSYEEELGLQSEYDGFVKKLKDKCAKKDAVACLFRLRRIKWGVGIKPNARKLLTVSIQICKLYPKHCKSHTRHIFQQARNDVRSPRKIRALYQSACKEEYAEACYDFGRQQYAQSALKPSYRKDASLYFEKACKLGHGKSCHFLAAMALSGITEAPDEAEAASYFFKGCASKHAPSCHQLGRSFRLGRGLPTSVLFARYFFQKACSLDNTYQCHPPVNFLPKGEEPKKKISSLLHSLLQQTLIDIRLSCVENNAVDCMTLGHLVRSGWDGEPDQDRALDAFEKACSIGRKDGCALKLYLQAHKKRFKWKGPQYAKTRQALGTLCQKEALACAMLGKWDETGALFTDSWFANTGKRKRAPQQALRWYQKGCAHKHQPSCYKVAAITLSQDKPTAADRARAGKLLNGACQAHVAAACKQLAAQKKKPQERLAALQLACRSFDAQGCERFGEKAYQYATKGRSKPLFAWIEQAKYGLEQACEQGRHSACFRLAKLLESLPLAKEQSLRVGMLYKRACERSTGASKTDACFRYASLMLSQQISEETSVYVRKLLQKQCDDKHQASCVLLAPMLEQGISGPFARERAKEIHKESCKRGEAKGCYQVARVMMAKAQTKAERAEATKEYNKACQKGHLLACFEVLKKRQDKVLKPKKKKKKKRRYRSRYRRNPLWLRMLGAPKYVSTKTSTITLGTKPKTKQPTSKKSKKSKKPKKKKPAPKMPKAFVAECQKQIAAADKRCQKGEESACHVLGYFHYYGIGTKKSVTKARRAFRKTCQNDNRTGCFWLGYLYDEGVTAGRRVKAKAVQLVYRACELRSAQACYYMGQLFFDKWRYSYSSYKYYRKKKYRYYKKYAKGGDWYRKKMTKVFHTACMLGAVKACTFLGHSYYKGDNFYAMNDQSNKLAVKYYSRGCQLDDGKACWQLVSLTDGPASPHFQKACRLKYKWQCFTQTTSRIFKMN